MYCGGACPVGASFATGMASAPTLSGVIGAVSREVLGLQAELQTELPGDSRCSRPPDTLTVALADAQAAEAAAAEAVAERKRKGVKGEEEAAVRKWARREGESLCDPSRAPFLSFNEEFFRHTTAADVHNLAPDGAQPPEDDPDFRVPELGRYYMLGAPPRCRSEPATWPGGSHISPVLSTSHLKSHLTAVTF